MLGDAAYGDVTELRRAWRSGGLLRARRQGLTSALPASAKPKRPQGSGRGRPPAARYRRPFDSLAGLARAAGEEACVEVGWREGTRGP